MKQVFELQSPVPVPENSALAKALCLYFCHKGIQDYCLNKPLFIEVTWQNLLHIGIRVEFSLFSVL